MCVYVYVCVRVCVGVSDVLLALSTLFYLTPQVYVTQVYVFVISCYDDVTLYDIPIHCMLIHIFSVHTFIYLFISFQ